MAQPNSRVAALVGGALRFVAALFLGGAIVCAAATLASVDAQEGSQELQPPGGVTAIGRGGAFAAVQADDVALGGNPTALLGLARPMLGLTYGFVMESDGRRWALAFAEPDQGNGAGLLGWTSSTRRIGYDAGTDTFRYERTQRLSYGVARWLAEQATEVRLPSGQTVPSATREGRLAGGVTLHYDWIDRDASSTTERIEGWAVDAGLLYRMTPKWQGGIFAGNIASSERPGLDGPEKPPVRWRLGVAYIPDRWTTAAIDLVATQGKAESTEVWAGAERWVRPDVALRVGIQSSLRPDGSGAAGSIGLTYTAGLSYRPGPWQLDLAYWKEQVWMKAGLSF